MRRKSSNPSGKKRPISVASGRHHRAAQLVPEKPQIPLNASERRLSIAIVRCGTVIPSSPLLAIDSAPYQAPLGAFVGLLGPAPLRGGCD